MRLSSSILSFGTVCMLAGHGADAAVTLDITNAASVKSAAATIVYDLMTYYTGNHTGDTPGNLPDPYYWWEAGAMFGTVINYWYYTGDTSYNDPTMQALLHQAGDDGDYMPLNQTKTEGNDDQGFWGMAAMTAAETKFPNPPDSSPGWLALAQGVFNTQAARWDNTTCGGGFRWQIFTFNSGYNYKNSISNGCVFNLAARLALYTGNSTYNDWAEKIFSWVLDVGLMSQDYKVYDGTQNTDNCTTKDHNLWTYNTGIYLLGAAAMYNHTNGSAIWETHLTGLVTAAETFFVNGVMYEPCENAKCNVDQRSFKAYLTRWLAATTRLAPYLHDRIMALLKTSAVAAAQTCTGGKSGNGCGMKWTVGAYDGSYGVGEQMSALEAVQSMLIDSASGWASDVAGTGISTGDENAGGSSTADSRVEPKAVTTGDRIGAGILTAIALAGVVAGSVTMALS